MPRLRQVPRGKLRRREPEAAGTEPVALSGERRRRLDETVSQVLSRVETALSDLTSPESQTASDDD
jgi:hypothetical protein